MVSQLQNWARNLTFSASRVYRPKSVEEVQEVVARSPRIRALGTRHSFNSLANTDAELVSLENLTQVVNLDRNSQCITFEGGLAYGRLAKLLENEDFALPNMASLPHISVAGACATATHGSGVRNRNLASSVLSVEYVTADGSLRKFERGSEGFDGAVVALGLLGVVVRITLQLVPSYRVRQTVFQRLPFSELESSFDEIVTAGYSVSLFTSWTSREIDQVWVKQKEDEAPLSTNFFGGKAATEKLHPLPGKSAENCTDQLGELGPWHERLPHFRSEFTPSSGEELQSELFVSRRDAMAAINGVYEMGDQIAPHLQITEIRTIAADEFWLSPQYQRDSVGIHFTWKQDWESVRKLLPLIEAKLAPFQPRAHWAKLFTLSPKSIRAEYPKLSEFRELVQESDPKRKFGNEYCQRYLMETAP